MQVLVRHQVDPRLLVLVVISRRSIRANEMATDGATWPNPMGRGVRLGGVWAYLPCHVIEMIKSILPNHLTFVF